MGRIHRTLVTCPTVPTWTMDLGPNHGWNGQVVSCLQFVTASLESFLLRRSHRLVSARFLFYTGTSRILWVRSTYVCFFTLLPSLPFPFLHSLLLFSFPTVYLPVTAVKGYAKSKSSYCARAVSWLQGIALTAMIFWALPCRNRVYCASNVLQTS